MVADLLDVLDDLLVPKVFLHTLAKAIELPLAFGVEHLQCLPILAIIFFQNGLKLLCSNVVFHHQSAQLLLADRSSPEAFLL